MNRLTVNNKVAILTSPQWGWYTQHGLLDLVYDPHIVVIHNNPREVEDYVYQVYRQEVMAEGLCIVWIALGSEYTIQFCLNKEWVCLRGDFQWITA